MQKEMDRETKLERQTDEDKWSQTEREKERDSLTQSMGESKRDTQRQRYRQTGERETEGQTGKGIPTRTKREPS